jgi:hypothetical protein
MCKHLQQYRYLTGFSNKQNIFKLNFRKMMTGTIVLLSILVALALMIIVLKCIHCVAHMHLMYTMRGHPGEGKDTVSYGSSGMCGDLAYCVLWKLPINICSHIWCCQSQDIVITV